MRAWMKLLRAAGVPVFLLTGASGVVVLSAVITTMTGASLLVQGIAWLTACALLIFALGVRARGVTLNPGSDSADGKANRR
jgi:hypothetical protein